MKRILCVLGALLWAGEAWATSNPSPSFHAITLDAPLSLSNGGTGSTNGDSTGAVFPAKSYGSCTWDSSHDVGACINAAIAAAVSAGGGSVVIPAGVYGVSTPIVQGTTGVHLTGAGVGNPRDTASSANFLAVTRLVWLGTAGSTMLDVEPSGSVSLYSADVTGIVFDCASLANIGAKVSQVSYSKLEIGGSNCRSINILLTTKNMTDGPGVQMNDIWLYSRSSNGSYSPTGIMLDSYATGATWNVSYNRIHQLYAWFMNGDGIVLGDSDNNIFDNVATYRQPGGTGTPFVAANRNYVSPNGVASFGNPYDSVILHEGTPILVTGYQSGSSIVANGTNSCNGGGSGACGTTTTTLTTSSSTGQLNKVLNFASTTGIAAGESVNCTGGSNSGVMPNVIIGSITGTTATMNFGALSTVASSTSCTFGYGVTSSAVQGTYTITATGASTFNITAPGGGHTQSGIAASGGFVTFTDLIWPFTGTATAGDYWTLTVPSPAVDMNIWWVDAANSLANPVFEYGSTGSFSRTGQPYPTLVSALGVGQTALVLGNGSASGQGAVALGGGIPTASGYNAFATGAGTFASGFGSSVIGHNTTASGAYSFGTGESNTTSGYTGFIHGRYGTDRGLYNTDTFGCGQFSVSGDCQRQNLLLRGTGNSTSAIRLTGDAATAGASNCINIPNNSAYALSVTVVAFDHTTVTKNESWNNWSMLMTRGANAASTALVAASTPTPLTNGTLTGSSISATADTTNGCLNVSFTPPTSNTDTFNVVAYVVAVEVQ